MYHGQEKHFYGRESPGPGTYGTIDKPRKYQLTLLFSLVKISSQRNISEISMPKGDRGLLTIRPNNMPSPFSYHNPNEIYK
jgi:hypothetical protein